ncbi:MAG: hypothetical protein LBS44_04380, partial [Deltaproteobacteria bacterium]|nr:hypothetical protein [Deltaproteobacteria bacterium]
MTRLTLTPRNILILSVIAAIIGSLGWIISDVLLIGYRFDPSSYEILSRSAFLKDTELASVMASGNYSGQALGSILAVLVGPLMIMALYHIVKLTQPVGKNWTTVIGLLLLAGFCWSPATLATYFPLGQSIRIGLHVENSCTESLLALAGAFESHLLKLWIPAVGSMSLGWLILLILTAANKTSYPRFFAALNPLPLGVLCFVMIRFLPESLAVPLAPAGISLGLMLFFLATLVLLLKKT